MLESIVSSIDLVTQSDSVKLKVLLVIRKAALSSREFSSYITG